MISLEIFAIDSIISTHCTSTHCSNEFHWIACTCCVCMSPSTVTCTAFNINCPFKWFIGWSVHLSHQFIALPGTPLGYNFVGASFRYKLYGAYHHCWPSRADLRDLPTCWEVGELSLSCSVVRCFPGITAYHVFYCPVFFSKRPVVHLTFINNGSLSHMI